MMKFLLPLALVFIWQVSLSQEQKNPGHNAHLEVNDELYTVETPDEGLVQSPINIVTCNIEPGNDHQISIECGSGIQIETITNTGHSIQLDFKSGSEVVLDNRHYRMIQAHFHTPSEHQVDGMTFPMEMHFVNQLFVEGREDTTAYLVIALLYKMGEPNKFISDFMSRIPVEEHNTVKAGEKTEWKQEWMLDDEDKEMHYYYYQGSLTTPPFNETVEWLVAKKIFSASPEQIRYINSLEGNNARHIHALYERKIESN